MPDSTSLRMATSRRFADTQVTQEKQEKQMNRMPPWIGIRLGDALRLARVCSLLIALLLFGQPARAADTSDVFGDIGSASVDESLNEQLAPDLAPDEGTVVGEVIDAENGVPVAGATVILIWPQPADGSEPRQEVQITSAAGTFRFPRVPEGDYRLNFIKSGYRVSAMSSFTVTAGKLNVADFPLPPKPADASGDVLNLEAFVVEASTVGDLMKDIDLRMESDALVDVMGTEDLARFAASDVGDALKRVSGVNVVEGRFAVIRGLEDRYSSTLFNGAPIPSSDPLRQSVQLDLFPSDIVSGIVVAKTFEASTPGNSGAGSIDIGTMGYPDDPTIRLSLGTGFNENAINSFLGYRENSPIAKFQDGTSVIESDLNLSMGGRREFFKRDFRAKFVIAREIDYDTAIGTIQELEPRIADYRVNGQTGELFRIRSTGDLALKQLTVSDGLFDFEASARTEQYTYYGALGMDIDRDGDHRIDFTAFYTTKDLEAVERRDNGYIPGFPYATTPPARFLDARLYFATEPGAFATLSSPLNQFRTEFEKPRSGPLSFLPIVRGQSIVQDRQLAVFQFNGEHDFAEKVRGLEFSWAANYAKTQQDETAFQSRYWYEPYTLDENNLTIPAFPPQVSDFAADGPGSWRTNSNNIIYYENQIDESQWFARGDLTYEFEPLGPVDSVFGTGIWYENSSRTLEFLEFLANAPTAGLPGVVNGEFVEGPSEGELGPNAYRGYRLDDLGAPGTSEFERQIIAGYFDLKLTFWDDLDVVGGVRLEQVEITSDNRPFTGACANPIGSPGNIRDESKTGLGCPPGYLPRIFPSRYLYLDRLDNPNNPFLREVARAQPGALSNDLLLNLQLPQDQNGFVDLLTPDDVFNALSGEIDEFLVLPMASLAYRPLDDVTLRFAYSQTAARPSFRELAYYASFVPGISERIVGNPFLQLSYVESFDTRAEYFWGDFGDLFAVSFFYKTIQNPIELIVLRDSSINNFPLFEGPFRVYRNNENEAKLWGVEFETRITLGLLGEIGKKPFRGSSFLEYFSIGGNFTYIDASVARSAYEISLAEPYFVATPEDVAAGNVKAFSLPTQRRLFNQPEWTANADITFNQPDWGSSVTLSVFAISDVLNAAGAADLTAGALPDGLVIDQFTDGYYQLDLVVSQSFDIPHTPGRWTFRTSIKNLTDSERGFVYDRVVTDQAYRSRNYTIGRDYSFSLQYQLAF